MENNRVFINGQWVTKPTKGKCAYCGSDLLEFYDDGTGICLNCGRTFSWLKPLAGPVAPQAQRTPPRRAAPPPREDYAAYAPPPPDVASKRAKRTPKKGREDFEESPRSAEYPEGPGFLSPRAISIMAFIGALLIGIGAIVYVLAMPMGSWPKYGDSELIGNLMKIGMIIWASGTMVFLMAGFAAAGTREMNYRVRATLIASSVALAILSFALWLGMGMMSMGLFYR